MKEYRFKRWNKIMFAALTIAVAVILSESILFTGGVIGRISSFVLLLFLIYQAANTIVYKIIIDDDFIKEKSLFETKKIFFGEVLQIEIWKDSIKLNTGTKKVQISKKMIVNSEELVDAILLPIINDRRARIYGDPRTIEYYSERFSGSPSLSTTNSRQLID